LGSLELAHTLVETLEEKKGEDILLLDIHEISDFTDLFLICSGTSNRMLDSLADAVLGSAKKIHAINAKVEGQASDGWLLIDLGDLVVHIFSPDQRSFYQLEQLWEKGKVTLKII